MFDRVPASYDRWNRLLTLGLDERWRRQAAALCLVDRPRRVLDLCTGTGDLALWLRRLAAAGTRVEALDFSRRMLAQAQGKVPRRGSSATAARSGSGVVGWVQADAAAMPYADARFDAVGIAFAFRNLTFAHPARDRFLAEIRRVLRPGGRFILSDIVSWDEPAVDSYLQAIEVLRDPSHVRDHSATQWFAFLQDAGFSAHIAERFPVRIDFEPWVQRINTPAPHLAALRSLLLGAPDEVRAALAVKTDCSFTLQGTLFAAEVPQP